MWGGAVCVGGRGRGCPDCTGLSRGVSQIVPLYLQIESLGRESPCEELDFGERLGRCC